MCFAVQLNPATVIRLIGDERCTKATIQNFNAQLREKIHAHMCTPDGYTRHKVGGRARAADVAVAAPDSEYKEAVRLNPYDIWARYPVEIDEGVCVCVCVCVCVRI